MESYPNEILLHIFAYLDYKSRISCKQVCFRWNLLIGTAPEFRLERNLTLNLNFNITFIINSETEYHSITVHKMNLPSMTNNNDSFKEACMKLGETVERIVFWNTDQPTYEFITKQGTHFPEVNNIIIRDCDFKANLNELEIFKNVESLHIQTTQIDLPNFAEKNHKITKVYLTLEELDNSEDLYKNISQNYIKINDLQIYSMNWQTGLNYQTILTSSPNKLKELKLCTMVKFHEERTSIEQLMLRLFERYHDLLFVRLNHTKAEYYADKNEIVITKIAGPFPGKQVFAFTRVK